MPTPANAATAARWCAPARRALYLPLALTVAALAGCALLGSRVLAIFGPEFSHATPVLLVLVATQVFRALAGPSPHMLTLSGAQILNASLCAGALAVLATANFLLGPMYGPMGAAWAVFFSYVGWTAATIVALVRLGEMRTDIFAVLGASGRASPVPGE